MFSILFFLFTVFRRRHSSGARVIIGVEEWMRDALVVMKDFSHFCAWDLYIDILFLRTCRDRVWYRGRFVLQRRGCTEITLK
jgi:hypothetical protein